MTNALDVPQVDITFHVAYKIISKPKANRFPPTMMPSAYFFPSRITALGRALKEGPYNQYSGSF